METSAKINKALSSQWPGKEDWVKITDSTCVCVRGAQRDNSCCQEAYQVEEGEWHLCTGNSMS